MAGGVTEDEMMRKFVSEIVYAATFIFVWFVIGASIIEPYIDTKAYVAMAGGISLIISVSVAIYVQRFLLAIYDDLLTGDDR